MNIRILSPSGAIDKELIEGAKERLLSLGWQVSEGQYARSRSGRFAATDAQRAADLNTALTDPSIDVILCARGGYGLQRIADKIMPIHKPVVGFSDITVLHSLAALTATPTLHAIMCKHMATHSLTDEPFARTIAALRGETMEYSLPAHPLNRHGEAEGILIGGNLSVLYGLQGTPYGLNQSVSETLYSLSAKRPILLIEDIAERHYHIDRMLNNLRLSGVLAQLGGLIVGQFSDCENDPSMGETIYETIARYTQEYDYPVVFDFPCGHVEKNMPLWLNKKARLSVSALGTTLIQA